MKNQIVWDFLIEIFEKEWKEVEEKIFNIDLALPYNIFLSIDDQNNTDLNMIYRQPSGSIEVTKRDLIWFLMLKKLRYLLI